MSYLIGTKTECENYIAKVDAYQQWDNDSTTTWAEPRKHPTKSKCAVQKCEAVEPDSDVEEVVELSSDWQPDDETN